MLGPSITIFIVGRSGWDTRSSITLLFNLFCDMAAWPISDNAFDKILQIFEKGGLKS